FANPSSSHRLGRELSDKIERDRKSFLDIQGCGTHYDFLFTSSATESNNTVIKGISLSKGDEVYVSAGDHPSLINPLEYWNEKGVNVQIFPMKDGGRIDEDKLLEKINKDTRLILFCHVNNQSGNIYNVKNLALKIKKDYPDIHIHVDDVQGFGKFPLLLKDKIIDTLSISSHKIGGPKGIAGLYIKKKIKISPLLHGGGQELELRSSTTAAPLIFSFTEAARIVCDSLEKKIVVMEELNRFAKSALREKIPMVKFPFEGDDISPYILNFILPGISSDIIVRHLEEKDIYVSTSSACSSGSKSENETFSALKIPLKYHNSVFRASFSLSSTKEEIKRFISETALIYDELKEFG
ncbi:MAG: aminotransferase class V-fold PLP-dependent enzyme, partial [Acidobacteriota bacterium]